MFLAGTGAVLLAAPLPAEAQKSEKMARVGILNIGPAPSPPELAQSVSTNQFWLSLRQLGWIDGHGTHPVEMRIDDLPRRLVPPKRFQ